MKELFFFTALFSFLTFTHAQTIDRFVSRGYVDGFLDNNWKGNPKSVELYNFILDENHQLTDEKIQIQNSYDEKGRHSKSTLIYDSTSEYNFEYDEKDRVVKFRMPNSEEVFSYNEKGQIIKSIRNSNSDKTTETKIYTYNSTDNELITSENKGDSILSETLHKMIKKDSTIEVTTFELKLDQLKPIQKVQFDKNEKRVSFSLLDKNSKVYTTHFYSYNKYEDVDKIKIRRFKDDGEILTEIVQIHYEYDTHGNKIKEEKTMNGILIDYTEYKITYY